MYIEKKTIRSGHNRGDMFFVFRFKNDEDKDWYLDGLEECAKYMDDFVDKNDEKIGEWLRPIIKHLQSRMNSNYQNEDGKYTSFLYVSECITFVQSISMFFIESMKTKKELEDTLNQSIDLLNEYENMIRKLLPSEKK